MNGLENNRFAKKRYADLIERGLLAAEEGDLMAALTEFRAAAHVNRSPDALTNWGWIEHHLGDTKKAIELCQEAIGLDPDCGGPYNDIGSYLVAMGRADEAVAWFKRAIASRNFTPRQYPHINLGKVFLSREDYSQALQHFEAALLHDPGNPEIAEIVRIIRTRLI